MMLTSVISGDSHQVTAEQFRTLVDVAVRMMKDASGSSGVDFTIGALHASAPTIHWEPQAFDAEIDVDAEFDRIAQRLASGCWSRTPGCRTEWPSRLHERFIGLPRYSTRPRSKAWRSPVTAASGR